MADAMAAIERNLRTYSIVDGVGRHDEQEIPRDVLREAVANALVHREYNAAFTGQAVSVEIYPDRVVIKSPGGLWGGKTIDNLADGDSICRNATLMKLMRFVSLPGEVGSPAEGNGTGIELMLREMASKSLPAPEFEAGIDSFSVTLGRHGTEIAEFQSWLAHIGCAELPQIERATLLTVKRSGPKTVRELHEQLSCDSDDVRAALVNLVQRGLLCLDKDGSYALFKGDLRSHLPGVNHAGVAVAENIVNNSDGSPRQVLIELLGRHDSLSAREMSAMTGRQISNIRYHLNRLIADGVVEPTAEATSVHRRYVLIRD